MRGKVPVFGALMLIGRITPAYAGKSGVFSLLDFVEKDHPRLCGEKTTNLFIINSSMGSPPPMRGKAFLTALSAYYLGITPAYAGKRIR